jgi:hypothetical protein
VCNGLLAVPAQLFNWGALLFFFKTQPWPPGPYIKSVVESGHIIEYFYLVTGRIAHATAHHDAPTTRLPHLGSAATPNPSDPMAQAHWYPRIPEA